jgi:predicted anti-sigma-YlaC factor YlaD
MRHAAMRRLAAGAALDDLEEREREVFDAHVGRCGACTRLSTELAEVVGDLALAAPALRAPAGLGAAIRAAIVDRRPAPPT